MRRILYLIVASICLTSCWVEEYDEMSKTYYAHQNYSDIESALKYTTQIVGDAEKIDQWQKATEQEKKLIEDAYFRNYKINQKGNIITITSVSNYNYLFTNRLYNTGGKALYDADSHWILATLMDTLDLKCVGAEQLKLMSRGDIAIDNNYNYYQYDSNFDLTFTKSATEEQYNIKGAGNVTCHTSRNTYVNIDYEIVNDIVVNSVYKQNELYVYSSLVQKGEVEYSWESKEDKANAKIISSNLYVISYKGFTENWPRLMHY